MAKYKEYCFSILIPTWNNIPYLKCCIESLRKNSTVQHQIILHINEGKDGTQDWAESEGIEFTYSEQNVGVCKAVNSAFTKAKHNYICFINDDMYALPGWDEQLIEKINGFGNNAFYLSSTMIEPNDTRNNCVIVKDYGKSIEEFREEQLLSEYQTLAKSDWSGATWPPSVVHREYWEKVGGYSEEFSPGLYSDPDFSMKLWEEGVRAYCGVGKSLVYHFQSKSVGRVKLNDGKKQFLQKWGMTARYFKQHYLKLGKTYNGKLPEPNNQNLDFLVGKFKKMLS